VSTVTTEPERAAASPFNHVFRCLCKALGGLTLASSQTPTQPLAHPPPQQHRGENRKNKSKKTYRLKYRQFNRGRKGKTSQTKEIARYIPQADQCLINLQTDTLEAKTPFFFLCLIFYFRA